MMIFTAARTRAEPHFFVSTSTVNKTGTVGAAAAVNKGARKVDALIANSTVNTTGGDLNVNAIKNGVDVAAALGLAVAVTQNASNTNVAAGVGVNLADNDVRAMVANSDTGSTDKAFDNLNVNAASNDIQVAGGADISLALGTSGKASSITATVMLSEIDNDLQAGIENGNHFAANADIATSKSDVQVNAGLSVGVSSSADSAYVGSGNNPFVFNGTATYGEFVSTSDAFIDNAKLNASSVNLLNDQKVNDNSKRQTLIDSGLDITGAGYMGEKVKEYVNPEAGNGALLVGAAVGVQFAYTGSSQSMTFPVGASIAVNKVKINDTVSIKDSTINTGVLVADSKDKLRLVNVSAGVAGSYSGQGNYGGSGSGHDIVLIYQGDDLPSTGFHAVGSVGWNVGSIDNGVNVSGSDITAHTVNIGSENDSQNVNVAGEVSIGQSHAVGLALAVNSLNNTVDSTVKNSTITGIDNAVNSIDIDSKNTSKIVELGVCANISTANWAVNGNIAINKGRNSTKAIADGLIATEIDWLGVNSDDKATKTTSAGNINISKDTNMGAGVAYTAIGKKDSKETLEATIKNSDITARTGGKIALSTKDGSTINSIAAGVGVAFAGGNFFKINAQGAGAASYLYKDVDAGLINTAVKGNPDLKVDANSDGDISTVATIISGSNQTAITGTVGVASSEINQDTDAFFKNDALNETANALGNVDIRATSAQKIAGGVGSSSITIGDRSVFTSAGSGSRNQIGSNTNALVENVNATVNKNFGVVSQSDDVLANYAGTVGISGGTD